MGEALDREGRVLAEAHGATKGEVFDKLMEAAPEADEIRIRSVHEQFQASLVDRVFAYHKPTEDGLKRLTVLREACTRLKRDIEACCPPSRERAVALTHLETAAMWANKAVTAEP